MTKKILVLCLILGSVLTGIYFRFYPRFLPSLDAAAREEVYSQEWKALKDSVEATYPDMRSVMDAKVLERLFKERLKGARPEIEAKIALRAKALKDRYRDADGRIYVTGIDSYYWLRLLDNLLKKGHIGDRRLGRVEFDDLIAAPIDPATQKNVHIWLGYSSYQAARFFNRGIALQDVLFYIPIFLSVIIAFFAFVVAKRLGAGDLGAFLASFAINVSPFFLGRSVSEWFDTDIYNILFPLLAFGMFLLSFQAKALLRRVGFPVISAVFLACYASTWKGWWFVFDIMVVSGLLFVLNQRLSRDEERGRTEPVSSGRYFLPLSVLFFATAGLVTLWNGFSVWKDCISEPLRLFSIMNVTSQSMWPNVYQTVAELGKTEPYVIVSTIGAPLVFFVALLGILYIFLWERSIRDERYGFGILCLVLWIISVFYASLQAMRFVLLLVVPVGFAFGLTLDRVQRLIGEKTQRFKSVALASSLRWGFVALIAMYCASNVMRNHQSLMYTLPQIDDHWYDALTKIKKETPKDAHISSWWDFGHWFKAIAQRRVLFDGMTQNTPYAYWVAGALLTSNEDESVAILKMIHAHGNRAAEILEDEVGMDAAVAVDTIRTALKKGRPAAEAYLAERLEPFRVQELLDILFPRHLPEVYAIISYDMIAKIGSISYIGNWDFRRVEQWFKKKRMTRDEFMEYLISHDGYTKDEAQKRLVSMSLVEDNDANRWFSRPFGHFSYPSAGRQDEELLAFDNGLVVNLKNNHAFVSSDLPGRRGVLKSLVRLEGGEWKVSSQKDPTLFYSALLIKEKEGYKSVLLDEGFATSMLSRLYFFKGEGLKHFKLFDEEKDDKGNAIYVYRLIW